MKKIFLFVGIGALLLAIPATLFFLSKQQDIRSHAAPATTLSLTPAAITKQVGDAAFKVNIDIDPGANRVVTAKLYITYDPTKLQATAITYGPKAPKVINSGIIESGTASITVGAPSNQQPITTKGTIAVLTLKPIGATGQTTPTQVQFGTKTYVAGLGEPNTNILVGSNASKITIGGGSATTTVTPTPTPSTTLTPTLTPTQGASNSGTATGAAILITSPTLNSSVSTEPTIAGTAPAGTQVTLVIYSTPQTFIVTTDSTGHWSFTPTTPLESGPHNVVASYQTSAGQTQTTTTSFVVVAGSGTGGGTTTESAMPVSGSMDYTIIAIIIGCAFLLTGALVPLFL